MVSRTSLRSVSSNSSKFKADSHSSHNTSSTAGRLSSDTSTRPFSTFTTCICSVLTRKFRSLPQFGQVNVTYDSFDKAILCNGRCQAQCKYGRNLLDFVDVLRSV